jgi:hypothetical protein
MHVTLPGSNAEENQIAGTEYVPAPIAESGVRCTKRVLVNLKTASLAWMITGRSVSRMRCTLAAAWTSPKSALVPLTERSRSDSQVGFLPSIERKTFSIEVRQPRSERHVSGPNELNNLLP